MVFKSKCSDLKTRVLWPSFLVVVLERDISESFMQNLGWWRICWDKSCGISWIYHSGFQ